MLWHNQDYGAPLPEVEIILMADPFIPPMHKVIIYKLNISSPWIQGTTLFTITSYRPAMVSCMVWSAMMYLMAMVLFSSTIRLLICIKNSMNWALILEFLMDHLFKHRTAICMGWRISEAPILMVPFLNLISLVIRQPWCMNLKAQRPARIPWEIYCKRATDYCMAWRIQVVPIIEEHFLNLIFLQIPSQKNSILQVHLAETLEGVYCKPTMENCMASPRHLDCIQMEHFLNLILQPIPFQNWLIFKIPSQADFRMVHLSRHRIVYYMVSPKLEEAWAIMVPCFHLIHQPIHLPKKLILQHPWQET